MSDRLSVFYGRVSREDSKQDSSVERQEFLAKDCGCDLILFDRSSGQTFENRENYNKLIDLIREGRVRLVQAIRSDRINRNDAEQSYFYGLCTKYNVEYEFFDEPQLNSSSPFGAEMRRRASQEAQLESERISRRMQRAYNTAEARGHAIARNKRLGFRIVDHKYELDTLNADGSNALAKDEDKIVSEADAAIKLVDLYLSVETMRGAHKQWIEWLQSLEPINESRYEQLLKFTRPSVGKWLRHPVTRGFTPFGIHKVELVEDKAARTWKKRFVRAPESEWRIGEPTHLGAITQEQWPIVKKILDRNHCLGKAIATGKMAEGDPASLASIFRCKECNCHFLRNTSKNKGKVYTYYYCSKNRKHNVAREENIRASLIGEIIKKAERIIEQFEKIKQSPVEPPPKLKELKEQKSATLKLYESTNISAYLDIVKDLDLKIRDVEIELSPESQIDPKIMRVFSNPDYWQSLDLPTLHRDLRLLIRTAWVVGGQVVEIDLDF